LFCSESVKITPDGDSVFLPHQNQVSAVNVMTSINCGNVDKSLNCEVGVDQPCMASTDKVSLAVDGTLATTSAFSQLLFFLLFRFKAIVSFFFGSVW
jgi:hypothetical protein